MKNSLCLVICLWLMCATLCNAQPGSRSKGPTDVPANPQPVGESGVAWYTTWETGLEEAKRSNRPIFFMSAATTCSGIPGVF